MPPAVLAELRPWLERSTCVDSPRAQMWLFTLPTRTCDLACVNGRTLARCTPGNQASATRQLRVLLEACETGKAKAWTTGIDKDDDRRYWRCHADDLPGNLVVRLRSGAAPGEHTWVALPPTAAHRIDDCDREMFQTWKKTKDEVRKPAPAPGAARGLYHVIQVSHGVREPGPFYPDSIRGDRILWKGGRASRRPP
ncbi:MAG: hypothetical protein ACYDCL_17875 [Myxococcales bacterium]